MKTLNLTNPLTKGTEVKAAQTLLHKHGYLAEHYIDGVYGTQTALASERAKFKLGYASADIKPTYGDQLNGYLKGKPLPPDFKARALARRGESFIEFEQLAMRQKIVAIAQWGVHNEHAIHYEQRRPIDGINDPYQLPLYTDCSGFVTLCYCWAQAPDPNGRNYDGLGYTGTLLSQMKHIQLTEVKVGDLVVYGSYPGHHVAMVAGGDDKNPTLISHGQEKGPLIIKHLDEQKYQPKPAQWLTLPKWPLHILR